MRRRRGDRQRWWRGRARWLGDEGGNTLVLVPVAVVLVLGLAALAIDATLLYLAERRLQGLAASVATDAAGAIDAPRFYAETSELVLDEVAAQRRAQDRASSSGGDRSFIAPSCEVVVDGAAAVATCTATAQPLLPLVWSGMSGQLELVATERAAAIDPAGG